ncbi:MAG: CinA family protein [Proteobacteria bacterium]|nr:CinA family protein [Pseudomonadota bacterium]
MTEQAFGNQINVDRNDDVIKSIGQILLDRKLRLVTAESLTGGLLAASFTSVPGSSRWFEGGFITYRSSAKVRLLGVPAELIDHWGAVSEPVASAMVRGALDRSDGDLAIAVTGIAGPEGGQPDLPVGTIWIAWADRLGLLQTARYEFAGARSDIRSQTVVAAIEGLRLVLAKA